jgi:lysozyme
MMASDPHVDITEEEAGELLNLDLLRMEDGVDDLVTAELSQQQFDALVAFSFNVGLGANHDEVHSGLAGSKLRRDLNAGDYLGVPAQLARWNLVNGVPSGGLTRRRAADAAIWSSGDYSGRP